MFYIQLIGLLGFCIVLLSFYKKAPKTILLYQVTSNFIYSVHYFLLGGLSGAFCCIIGMLRNIVLIKSRKKYIIVPIFITLYLMITFLFYEGIYSILPLLANVIYLIFIAYKDKRIILIGANLSSICWILYAVVVCSYVGAITESILLISNIINLIKISKDRKK